MNDKSDKPSQDYAALRRLLMGPEIEKLEALTQRVEVPENFSERVGEVLPQAMLKSARNSDKLSEAMVPTVEEILRLSIKRDINKFADALFPVIGPAIRKSISETFREMMQSLNRTLEQSFSWQGVKWRMESARSGIPVAQIALLKGLVFRVEQVFLIHRETGLLLQHLGREEGQTENADLVSSMLSAIRDFVGDSFSVDGAQSLGSIEIGELSLWIEQGPDAVLAVAIRGEAPNSLRTTLQKTLETLQFEYSDDLQGFSGDTTVFEESGHILDDCLQAQYKDESKGVPLKTKLILIAALLLLVFWLGFSVYHSYQQNEYVDMLRNQQGYIITSAVEEDGVLVVSGLRDPLSRSPQEMLAGSSLDETDVKFQLEPYYSLQPGFVLARAQRILNPPEGVELQVEGGKLIASGISTGAWRRQFEDRVLLIAGISAYDIDELETLLDMSLFSPPAGVSLRLREGVLYARGSADEEWIQSLRAISVKQPQVRFLDLSALINLSDEALRKKEQALLDSVAALQQQNIFFDVGGIKLDRESGDKISAMAKRVLQQAEALSRRAVIILQGHSDSIGRFEANVILSQKRAGLVAKLLIDSGINRANIITRGIDAPVEEEINEEQRRYNRRVSFQVNIE